jgi:hypothetical protein
MNLVDPIPERRKRSDRSSDPIMHLLWTIQRDYDVIDVPNDLAGIPFQE